MRKMEEKELLAKKVVEEERMGKRRKPSTSTSKRPKENTYLAVFNDDPAAGSRRIARMMDHAKLKVKRKTITSLDQAIEGVDPGPYGPKSNSLGAGDAVIKSKSNQPNTRLPEKCPW